MCFQDILGQREDCFEERFQITSVRKQTVLKI